MLESLFTVNALISLSTLTLMEIVLGIDNLIFISILSDKLPAEVQNKARVIGLALALIMRLVLLKAIAWIVGFKEPLFEFHLSTWYVEISIRDLILLGGGLFLIVKSVQEIHEKVEGHENSADTKLKLSLFSAILQIVFLDIVFSFDSILTAIGLVDDPERDLIIIVIAVVISLIVMLFFAKPISDFVNTHPTIKMLALSFLLLIGILLVAEAFEQNIPKGYIYFSIAFSLAVESLNMWSRKKQQKPTPKNP
jgi:predicted tellurium resistance membrane protein TerC